jgi:hypothetical protein
MRVQTPAGTERLSALGTDEGLRSTVGGLMTAQICSLPERFAALVTNEPLRRAVGELMTAQIAAVTEGLLALAADEWLLSAVSALMRSQCPAVSKRLVASIAHEPVWWTASLSLCIPTSRSDLACRCAFAHSVRSRCVRIRRDETGRARATEGGMCVRMWNFEPCRRLHTRAGP